MSLIKNIMCVYASEPETPARLGRLWRTGDVGQWLAGSPANLENERIGVACPYLPCLSLSGVAVARIVEVEQGDQTLEMTSRTRTTGSRTRSLCRGRRYGGGWAKFDNFSFLKSNVDDLTLLTSNRSKKRNRTSTTQ